MRVKLLQIMARPEGTHKIGDILTVDEEFGKRLIKIRAAELVPDPLSVFKSVEPSEIKESKVEEAIIEQPERAVKRGRPKRVS